MGHGDESNHTALPIHSFGSSQGLRLELVESIAFLGRIDSENHALSTVRDGDFLSAVKPQGIVGWDFEFDDLVHRMIGVDWFETRVKAIGMTMLIGQLRAWVVE